MMKIKDKFLKKLLLILLIILCSLLIIKESKIIGFCCNICKLISPLFFGYVIAWLIKPIMLKFNKRYNIIISSILTYLIFIIIIGLLGYLFIPVVVNEVKNLVPNIINFYHNLPKRITNNMDFNKMGEKVLLIINNWTSNIKTTLLNIFYSVFISYFYLISYEDVSKFLSKYIPFKLKNDISINLRSFVKGTLIDTGILFLLTIISFYIVKMPYALLFGVVISLTNIIPYIGPYIGGIPAVIVAFSVSSKIGITVLIIIVILQFVESSFIHPFIMSKSLNISPIFIIMGLIVLGYFFGIFGMLVATPLVSIIKSIYLYYKKTGFKPVN